MAKSAKAKGKKRRKFYCVMNTDSVIIVNNVRQAKNIKGQNPNFAAFKAFSTLEEAKNEGKSLLNCLAFFLGKTVPDDLDFQVGRPVHVQALPDNSTDRK